MLSLLGPAGSAITLIFLKLAGKALLLTFGATVAVGLTRRLSAAGRHWILVAYSVALLALPPATLLLPSYSLELPESVRPALSEAASALTRTAPSLTGIETEPAASQHEELSSSSRLPTASSATTRRLSEAFLLVWSIVTLFLLARILTGYALARRRLCRAERLEEHEWCRRTELLSRRLNVRRRVELYLNEQVRMPMTVGILRPAIILPANARQWPESHIQVVLLHELAHVRRLDLVSRLLSRVAVALYWFNPLVWWHDRILRRESERACDDEVLCSGTIPSKYARHLLVMARTIGAREHLHLYAPAFGESGLETRIRSILDPHRRRRMPGFQRCMALLAVFSILVAISSFSFSFPEIPESPATLQQEPPPPPKPAPAPEPLSPPPGPPAPAPPPDTQPPPAEPPAPPPPPEPPPPPPPPEEAVAAQMKWEEALSRVQERLRRAARDLAKSQRQLEVEQGRIQSEHQRIEEELERIQNLGLTRTRERRVDSGNQLEAAVARLEIQRRKLEEEKRVLERQAESVAQSGDMKDLQEEIARLKSALDRLKQ